MTVKELIKILELLEIDNDTVVVLEGADARRCNVSFVQVNFKTDADMEIIIQ